MEHLNEMSIDVTGFLRLWFMIKKGGEGVYFIVYCMVCSTIHITKRGRLVIDSGTPHRSIQCVTAYSAAIWYNYISENKLILWFSASTVTCG